MVCRCLCYETAEFSLAGVQPSVFLCASFGKVAKDAIHAGKDFSLSKGFESVGILFCLQFVVLLPTFYKKQLNELLGITDADADARNKKEKRKRE